MWYVLGYIAFIVFVILFFNFVGKRREAGDKLVEKHFGKNA